MKKILFAFLFIIPMISYSQKQTKDSILSYQRQLAELRKATYDSMINSPKYKALTDKLNRNENRSNDNFGVEVTFFTGVQINDYRNLNARLTSLGVEKKESFMVPIGVGLGFRFSKIILGFDGTPVLIGDNSAGYYVHGYISTNMLRTKKLIFSPQIGYGGQTVIMRVPTKNSSSDFNSYFTTSANQVGLEHHNSGFDFGIALKKYPSKRNDYIPLFRVGYRYAPKEEVWKVSNGTSLNAPSDRNNIFYFQLMIGSGD